MTSREDGSAAGAPASSGHASPCRHRRGGSCGGRRSSAAHGGDAVVVGVHVAYGTPMGRSSAAVALAGSIEVPGLRLPWLDDLVRARRPGRLPVVLSWDGGDSRSTDGEAPSMSAR